MLNIQCTEEITERKIIEFAEENKFLNENIGLS